jgi:hypothetical protein
MRKVIGWHAISGVTFFGLKRSARATACSAVDSPPHVLKLNNNGDVTERRERTRAGNPTNNEDNNSKSDDNVDDFSHICNRDALSNYN